MWVSEWPHRRPSGLGGGHATCCCSHSTGNLKHICVFKHQRFHDSSFVRSSSDRCQKVNLMRDYNFTLILFWPKIFFQSPSDFYVPLILALHAGRREIGVHGWKLPDPSSQMRGGTAAAHCGSQLRQHMMEALLESSEGEGKMNALYNRLCLPRLRESEF